jgi:TonB family protein
MRWQLRVPKASLLLVVLIGSAQCTLTSPRTSAEPSCRKRSHLPEVRSGPDCKEIESPVLLACVDPDYPPDVRKRRLEGKVVATATLNPDGTLQDFKIVSTPSEVLSGLALDAFRQWRYKPAFCRDLGKPILTYITMTTTFSLH